MLEKILLNTALDVPRITMALAWLASTVLGICLFVNAVLLKKPWLSMRHMHSSSEQADT